VKDGENKNADGKPAMVQTIQFYSSPNLKEWIFLSQLDGFFECPDIFELPLDGDRRSTRWVVFGANGDYLIGRFDGTKFMKESGKHKGDFGKNFYAAQSFSDIPESDGRRILIGWMNAGKYPGMPFNQQMSFPCELTLRSTPEGIRMFKWPVKEIERVYSHAGVSAGDAKAYNSGIVIPHELADIQFEFKPEGESGFELNVRGHPVTWSPTNKMLSALGRSTPLPMVDGRVKLRALIDRASLELFGNDGAVTMSSCFLPRDNCLGTTLLVPGNASQLVHLRSHELKSAWPQAAAKP
jgi:sucrose-6-phosphate hydrolase SacC (GH32 family)